MSGLFDDIFSGAGGIANTVLNLVGTPVTYLQKSKAPYNPLTINQTSLTDTSIPMTSSPKISYSIREIDGLIIKKGDCKVIISATNINFQIEPNSDRIDINGEVWTVIDWKPYSTGTQNAAFEFHLRK